MTETARRLHRLGAPHARARALAVLLAGLGVALAAAALGLVLAPAVSGVTLAWVLIALSLAAAVWAVWRVRREAAAAPVGRLVESATGGRAGSVVGVVSPSINKGKGTSAALLLAADTRAAAFVSFAAPDVNATLRRTTRRRLAAGGAAALLGAVLFVAGAPASGRAAAFWHPVRAWRDAHAPVRLTVDRRMVRRGGSLKATVTVPGAVRVTLWTRGAGEPWKPTLLTLDADGKATRQLGPIESDLYLKAASGGRRSGEIKVTVSLPAFLADLGLTARFPSYLGRSDEPLLAGPDLIPLPVGTAVLTSASASVPIAGATWILEAGSRAEPQRVHGNRIEGRFIPFASGTWRLQVRTVDGAALEGVTPELRLQIVPDSAPVVTLPVPARDTTLPLSLHQQLVADVRDDHGISKLAVVSWRISRTGRIDPAVRESLDVSGVGDRAIVQGRIDAEHRNLLPGDTLRLYVEAWDNAPEPQRGRSAEVALRLPSMEELRAEARAAARAVAGAADSVAGSQRELSDRTRDLAQERSRDATSGTSGRQQAGNPQSGSMSFQATQRAEEIARDQAAMSQRIAELSQAVEEIARAAKAAGVDDTAFQNRLRQVQELLQQAITPELQQRLRELQEALARLDPEATRQALQRLAEAQQQLRHELERSQELFKRAALEGELASLAKDAEDLQRRQTEWNKEDAPRADSAAVAAERDLAAATDSLAHGVERAGQSVSLKAPEAAARRAQNAMEEAADAAGQNNSRGARRSGQEAADSLGRLPEQLRQRRDSLASAWRQETLDALDRALSETAALARRQQEVADALRSGEAGAPTRAQQAAIEEGTQAVEQQISKAAGRHALVSPQLEAALGFAQNQMRQSREQLEQSDPNAATAAPFAEQALDALNATAHALVRTAQRVSGAQSGSGFQEALEQLARMAQEQQGMNGAAQGLLPMMGLGGQAIMQRVRELASRQRALAEQLERLQAEGAAGGGAAGALAQEARELARQLEAGRLDRRTLDRQQQLYRKLLDAGRSLTGEEPDDQKQRTSRSATGDSIHIPTALLPGATGSGPKLRYPTWDELSGLTPEQRRLVLEYFRRLNENKP